MSLLSNIKNDSLVGKVILNSIHLFSNNSISLALSFLMGILSARLLGVDGFGLVGVVMSYASTINSLLSFRMSELVVRYGGEYLERGNKEKAAALIKSAAATEAFVSLLAFLLVIFTSGLAAHYISKMPSTAWMFSLFALGLLANFNYETSIGILQITDKIKLQGTINLIQSIVGLLVVILALLLNGSVVTVVVAYLLSKVILGLGVFISAQIQLRRLLGSGWWKVSIKNMAPYGGLIRFAVNSNISATIIKIFRESELLWVGGLLTLQAVGYYRAAYAIIGLLSVAADPLIATVYPEINRLITQKAWPRLRDFLHKVTTISFAYNIFQALGFVLFGRWILWVYGKEYVNAYPALIAFLVGLAFNYTLFWNRPLLLSLGLTEFPIVVTMTAGLLKLALTLLFVPRYGYVMAAALLSFYYLLSVGIMAWRGLKEIHSREAEIGSLTAE